MTIAALLIASTVLLTVADRWSTIHPWPAVGWLRPIIILSVLPSYIELGFLLDWHGLGRWQKLVQFGCLACHIVIPYLVDTIAVDEAWNGGFTRRAS